MGRKNTRTQYTKQGNRKLNVRRVGLAAALLLCSLAAVFIAFKAGAAAQTQGGALGTKPALTLTQTPIVSSLPTPTLSPTPSMASSPSPSASITPENTKSIKETPVQSPIATPKAIAQPTQTVQPVSTATAKPVANSGALPDILLQKKISVTTKSDQIVFVLASGSKAEVTLYEKNEQGWNALVKATGSVGKSGVSANRKEGDGSTPMGVYKLGFAFGNKNDPGTKMEYRDVTGNSYWVDDAKSHFYNKWVEGTENKDWSSAEELWKMQTAYAYALVVEYNYGSSTVPGKGSAIFLHCGSKPTVGCIAIPEEKMKAVLKLLNPQKNPIIVITK